LPKRRKIPANFESIRKYSPAGGHPASATLRAAHMPGKSRVSYFYDADVGNYYYGAGHPMLATAIACALSLIVSFFRCLFAPPPGSRIAFA
jgi:hypothetical protein